MNLNEYVGIPWLERGRTRDGCDCWGLVRIVYKDKWDIELPSYDAEYDTIADRAHLKALMDNRSEEFMKDGWHEIYPGEERPGDGVLMRLGSYPIHVGIVQSSGRLLHIDFGMASSALESYKQPKLCKRIVGFYRHCKVPA